MFSLIFSLFIVFSYLLGSISSAIILSKILGFPDPRTQGSNNPGATNVLRIAGKKAAALTLIFDLLKGLVPVLISYQLFIDNMQIALIGLAAFLGHCYPIFFNFKGGKGVATAIGATLAFNWISGLFVISIWLIIAKGFKISSLAALIAFILLPGFIYWQTNQLNITLVFGFISLILVIRHKQNIQRLFEGSE